ncbi:MAG: hypothetical protein Q7K34_01260 [archaeon]|nr:hypothetical protein [archaeon]
MAEEKKISLNEEQLAQLFQLENQRFSATQERISALRNILMEMLNARDAVQAISKGQKNNKALIPIGGGVLVEAALENNKTLLFSMAGNVAQKKTTQEIEAELSKRVESVEKSIEKENAEANRQAANLNNILAAVNNAQARRQPRV